MSSRMRKPETVLLNITRGDWLLVKKDLNAGEHREMLHRMIDTETQSVQPVNVGISKMISYLLDWSITDSDDKPVVIRDQPDAVVKDALNALDIGSFREIVEAIENHDRTNEAERAKAKKSQDGVNESSPSSPSAAPSGGATTTSTNSQQMSIA